MKVKIKILRLSSRKGNLKLYINILNSSEVQMNNEV